MLPHRKVLLEEEVPCKQTVDKDQRDWIWNVGQSVEGVLQLKLWIDDIAVTVCLAVQFP